MLFNSHYQLDNLFIVFIAFVVIVCFKTTTAALDSAPALIRKRVDGRITCNTFNPTPGARMGDPNTPSPPSTLTEANMYSHLVFAEKFWTIRKNFVWQRKNLKENTNSFNMI